MNQLTRSLNFPRMTMLHFAAESRFQQQFRGRNDACHTADISSKGPDCRVDVCRTPSPDHFYDIIFASHLLEHVKDDALAIAVIPRVIKPKGIDAPPVPVVAKRTVEYPYPNPAAFGHARAVGPDYFERYRVRFPFVKVWTSKDFDERYQLYTYEDRSGFPTQQSPHRTPMTGTKHLDYVPVCFAGEPPALDGI